MDQKSNHGNIYIDFICLLCKLCVLPWVALMMLQRIKDVVLEWVKSHKWVGRISCCAWLRKDIVNKANKYSTPGMPSSRSLRTRRRSQMQLQIRLMSISGTKVQTDTELWFWLSCHWKQDMPQSWYHCWGLSKAASSGHSLWFRFHMWLCLLDQNT